MNTRLHAHLKAMPAPSLSFKPVRIGVLQRTNTFGQGITADNERPSSPGQLLESGISPSMKSRFDHDFSRVPVHNNAKTIETTRFRDETLLIDQGGGSPSPAPPVVAAPPGPSAASGSGVATVDRIDIIDSMAGAISGYPPITSGDLNSPGPFNNTATGGVNNVHQIHFHLDSGNSAFVTPRREIQRSAVIGGVENKNPPDRPAPGGIGPVAPGGFSGVLVGPDGPAAHEVIRPTADKIVVADAPGIGALSSTDYPFTYKSHFTLTVADTSGTDIARIKYDVMIEKRSAADIPNTENRITAVEKEDLVRQMSLR